MKNKFKDIKRVANIDEFVDSLEFDQLPMAGQEIPLYHYTSIYGLEGIIKNKELWLSKSEFLNDKLELKYTLDTIMMLIEQFMGADKITEELVFKEWIKRSIQNKFFSLEIYTISLSTNKDSNLLWSNYANNDGYNIEFIYSELLHLLSENIAKSHEPKKVFIFPYAVIYNKEKQLKLLRKELINLYKIFLYAFDKNDESLYYKYGAKPLANIVTYSIFFKDSSFHQEEEFRFAVYFTDESYAKKVTKFRIRNGIFIPYIPLSVENYNNRKFIQSITIGPKNSLDIAEAGMEHFLDNNDMTEVEVKKSKIPYRY
ncbi:DUF2971 domain-containing protein [Domibacillus tundrae]|uniref:DUF2971 domain-containing protein n=1 Tax=Domibacillus tundrae TaxID=1587527 RepID=UPI0033966106